MSNTIENKIDYGVAEIQALLIETLDEFDAICKKNKIHYSLHGGTLLGAERNHRLIPWDDDVDVSMTRREYEKFKKVVSNLSGKFHLDEKTMWFPRFVMKCENELAYIYYSLLNAGCKREEALEWIASSAEETVMVAFPT